MRRTAVSNQGGSQKPDIKCADRGAGANTNAATNVTHQPQLAPNYIYSPRPLGGEGARGTRAGEGVSIAGAQA
jgi:hypothetical protein